MPAPILIVGQGLAGTLLGWELERQGAEFEIVDAVGRETPGGHQASAVAAGIVNPITGQRIVKSWRVDHLLPLARETYRSIETAWGVEAWRDFRVRRKWANEGEREIFATKQARGDLAPFAGESDSEGFWIEGAGVLDVPALVAAARGRWTAEGRLGERVISLETVKGRYDVVILCTGAAMRAEPSLAFVPWAIAKGELLTVETSGLDPRVILNQGHWALPLGEHRAKVGATYEPNASDPAPSGAARLALEASARDLLGQPFTVESQGVGLRLTVADKHPVAGRVPDNPALGVLGALGSKGSLVGPWLARQWWNHLSEGVPFDPAIDVARFYRG